MNLWREYDQPIIPTFHRFEATGTALYPLIQDLSSSIRMMILSPEDLEIKYGILRPAVSAPKDSSIVLDPSETPYVWDPENPDMPNPH